MPAGTLRVSQSATPARSDNQHHGFPRTVLRQGQEEDGGSKLLAPCRTSKMLQARLLGVKRAQPGTA
jgi:hypothetical protein